MKKLLLFILTLTIQTTATIRYVKAGNPTPLAPYTSLATAADSIWKALRISVSGDTVFVGNGTYREQDTLPFGVSLIGAGADSCVWDCSPTAQQTGYTLTISDYNTVSGFTFKGYISFGYHGKAINGPDADNSIIIGNKFIDLEKGVSILSPDIIDNHFEKIIEAIRLWFTFIPVGESNVINNRFINCNTSIKANDYKTYIRNNYFYYDSDRTPTFIHDFGGGQPEIFNNFFVFNGQAGPTNIYQFISGHHSDLIRNNILISKTDYTGGKFIFSLDPLKSINNHFEGKLKGYWIWSNAVTSELVIKNNNYWLLSAIYDFAYTNPYEHTQLQKDPMFIDSTDFHLQKYSPLIDRGDSSVLDKDGTISDIGVYGGAFGESYVYIDKAPRAPSGLTVTLSADTVLLKWKKNTESDIRKYYIYTDSTTGVTTDTTRYLTSSNDTLLKIPKSYFTWGSAYFRIAAVDSGYNKSQGSIAVGVVLTGMGEGEEIAAERYRLYQNYPNPYGGAGKEKTKISYELKKRGYVKLRVYNVVGEELAVLVNGEQEAGYYEEEFGAPEIRKGLEDHILTSGIYIYKLEIRDSETGHPVFNES
ncbi:MAG: hypothetical protein HUU54_17445, partial [Ignavibacteriaceae bacterium]|nr:hypothetical protein [Ignavibacteriaceae bacterium]